MIARRCRSVCRSETQLPADRAVGAEQLPREDAIDDDVGRPSFVAWTNVRPRAQVIPMS